MRKLRSGAAIPLILDAQTILQAKWEPILAKYREFVNKSGYKKEKCLSHCSIEAVMGLWKSLACDIRNSGLSKIRLERNVEPYISNY